VKFACETKNRVVRVKVKSQDNIVKIMKDLREKFAGTVFQIVYVSDNDLWISVTRESKVVKIKHVVSHIE